MRQLASVAHAVTARIAEPIDRLCIVLATVAMLVLAVCIILQIVARFVNVPVLWAGDISGYALVATTFMAMCPALRRGVHIRVSLVMNNVGPRTSHALDVWSYLVGLAFTAYGAWWSVVQVHESWRFGDLSTGLVPFPLWMPQTFMALGFIALAVAMLEGLLARLAGAVPVPAERAGVRDPIVEPAAQ